MEISNLRKVKRNYLNCLFCFILKILDYTYQNVIGDAKNYKKQRNL